MIDIRGIDKAVLLKALHDGTTPDSMRGHKDLGRDLSIEEARVVVKHSSNAWQALYFEYCFGRPLYASLKGDYLDPEGYDRHAGEGAAARVVAALRVRAIP